jgi:hypothetical protein
MQLSSFIGKGRPQVDSLDEIVLQVCVVNVLCNTTMTLIGDGGVVKKV